MKEILDTIVLFLFIFMLAMFVINFNKEQIKKYTDKLEKKEKRDQQKEDKLDE